MLELFGLVGGIGVFAVVFYFGSDLAYRWLNPSLGFAAFIAFPLGAAFTWCVMAGAGLFISSRNASPEDRRSAMTFSALVPVVGMVVYCYAFGLGAMILTQISSFWGRFGVSSAIMAFILITAWLFLRRK